MKLMTLFWRITTGIACLFLLNACKKGEPSQYSLDKTKEEQAKRSYEPLGTAPTSSSERTLQPTSSSIWSPPSNWTPLAAEGPFTIRFGIPDPSGQNGELGLMRFPAEAGSDLDFARYVVAETNQPWPGKEEVEKMIQTTLLNGRSISIINWLPSSEATGEKVKAVQAALLRTPQATWFARLLGSPTLLMEQSNELKQLMATFPFPGPQTASTLSAAQPAPQLADTAKQQSELKWETPEEWQPGKVSNLRLASFLVSDGKNDSLDISVTSFPGSTGSLVSNINRWRGQIQLPPIEKNQLLEVTTPIHIDNEEAVLVDLSSDTQRIIVAVLEYANQSLFFKLTGDQHLAEQQYINFIDFLASIELPRSP